jgi:ectoine hydroxylase-related dioxygenase (phytanoyl-CoA dioxygenase family)
MNENQIIDISTQIKKLGVWKINNFLNSQNFNLAKNVLNQVQDETIKKGDYRGVYPIDSKSIFIKLIKMQFKQIKKSFILKKIAKDLNLKKIAEMIFDHKAELHMIDSYHSKKSNKNIIDWHCDMAYNGAISPKRLINLNDASIKFFFYMSDVKSLNGSLGYIPGSHNIVKALASLILKKKIEYKPYWKLEDLRKHILYEPTNKLLSDIIGQDKINFFLKNSDFITSDSKDTTKFDYEMNKGGVVIFDEFGVHRGSMPSTSDRLVLRFFYRKKI